MTQPTGIPDSEIIKQLALIQATGEMQIPPIPPGQLQSILAKARKDMEEKP